MVQTEIKRLDLSVVKIEDQPKPLADALVKLGIQPLDWRDVWIYQMERKQEVERLHLAGLVLKTERPYILEEHRGYGWKERELWSWKQNVAPIPDHVQEIVDRVAEECPSAEFFVCHLGCDPFLVAYDRKVSQWRPDQHSFYLACWGEEL